MHDQLVARQYGIEPADLKAHGNRTGFAFELACRLTGWTHRAIGVYYGGISCTAVNAGRRRLREGAADINLMERLRAKLTEEMMVGRHSQ